MAAPTHVATDVGTDTGTSVDVTIDALVQDDDLVFVTFTLDGAATVTPPAGWNPLPRLGGNTGHNAGGSLYTYGYYQFFDGNANVSFALSQSRGSRWVTSGFRGVDLALPIGGISANTQANAANLAFSDVPPRHYVDNLVVAVIGYTQNFGDEGGGSFSSGTWTRAGKQFGSNMYSDILYSESYATVDADGEGTGPTFNFASGSSHVTMGKYSLVPAGSVPDTPDVLVSGGGATGGGTTASCVNIPDSGTPERNILPGSTIIVFVTGVDESATFTCALADDGAAFTVIPGLDHIDSTETDMTLAGFYLDVTSNMVEKYRDESNIESIVVTASVSSEYCFNAIVLANVDTATLTTPVIGHYTSNAPDPAAITGIPENGLALQGIVLGIGWAVNTRPTGYTLVHQQDATGAPRNDVCEKTVAAGGSDDPSAYALANSTSGILWGIGVGPPVSVVPSGGMAASMLTTAIC